MRSIISSGLVVAVGMALTLTACTAAPQPPSPTEPPETLAELWALDGVQVVPVDDRYRFDAPESCEELASRFEAGPWRSVPIIMPLTQSGVDAETGESYTVTLALALIALEGPERSAMVSAIDGTSLCSADLVLSSTSELRVSGAFAVDGTARQLPFMCTPILGADDEVSVQVLLDSPGTHIVLSLDVQLVQGPQELSSEVTATVLAGDESAASRLAALTAARQGDELGAIPDDPAPGRFAFTNDSRATVTLEGQNPVRGHLDATGLEDVTGARIDIAADFRC